jgi:hypothetical protein
VLEPAVWKMTSLGSTYMSLTADEAARAAADGADGCDEAVKDGWWGRRIGGAGRVDCAEDR